MKLREALKIIGIENILKEKTKEGTQLVLSGRFECCNELNEAIRVIRRFINENNK